MAEYVNEGRPADRVIVQEREIDSSADSTKSNTGMVIGLIVLAIILLMLLFGRNLFGGGNAPVETQIRPTAPTTAPGE